MDIAERWERYRTRKRARDLLKHTRKQLRMHRDIIEPRLYQHLQQLCGELKEAVRTKSRTEHLLDSMRRVDETLAKALPPAKGGSIRENVEVFLVAAIVAMAIRSFFIQPFKIPTGSMQPTLYGVHKSSDDWQQASLPKRIADWLLFGQWPSNPHTRMPASLANFLGWIVFGQWPAGATYTSRGDHIFVDRFTYHFRPPQRGEIIVFETNDIYKHLVQQFRFNEFEQEQLREKIWNKFYIKRLVAVGGDRVQIRPPHLIVNGEILDAHGCFRRIYSRKDGYEGYLPAGPMSHPCYLATETDVYEVPPRHYFVLGDNSRSSFDSRFWGAFPRRALIGRAVFVYWPFTKRFGIIQ